MPRTPQPGRVPPERQIELLEQDYQKARSREQAGPARIPRPPGLSLLSDRPGGPGAPGVRDREGPVPGIRRVHGPAAGQPDPEMSTSWAGLAFAAALCGLTLTGCATTKSYDYTNYRAYPPRSILVLPPLNESTDIRGTYGYLSTVTRPIAELGYYVYPVVVVDHFSRKMACPRRGRWSRLRSTRSARSLARTRCSTSPSGSTGPLPGDRQ